MSSRSPAFTHSAPPVSRPKHFLKPGVKNCPATRYPLPVALLGRLAVSRQFQGQGLGSILLADACKRISAASQTLGVAAIVVDAKSAQAATFYQHFGFLALPGQPGRWMLPRSHFVGVV